MNSVERVKTLCKKCRIPISKLEKDLGYSNGYIGQLRKGTFPADRLKEIADYFNVSADYLMTGEEPNFDPYNEDMAHLVSKTRNDIELSNALLKYFELSDAKKNHVVELINLLSEE